MFKQFFTFILLYILLISNSFAAIVTHKQTVEVNPTGGDTVAGVQFNSDGTKMFTSYRNKDGDDYYISEYNLSTPYDISTRVYAGDSERCHLTDGNTVSGGLIAANNNYFIHELFFKAIKKQKPELILDSTYKFSL